MKIKNDEQAYLHALVLSITAPTEEEKEIMEKNNA